MSPLGFYMMMWYPIPLRSEFFAYQQTDQQAINRPLQSFWSRLQPPSETMQAYIALLTKRQWVWKYIPWVQSVYIANSLTFNAVHETSNIDFFIVTRNKRLWTTHVLVNIVFFIIRLREKQATRTMRFSADFFVTQETQDLSRILLTPSDPYLVYWLAHLVPYYHRDFVFYDSIYEENKRLQYYLPSFPFRQTIFLWIDVLIWSSVIKRFGEWIMYSLLWIGIEYGAKACSLLFLRWKKYRLPALTPHILVASWLYKSYDDKRKWYALQREVYKKIEKNDKK